MHPCPSCSLPMKLVKKLKLGGKRVDRMKCECGVEQSVRAAKDAEHYLDRQEEDARQQTKLEKKGSKFVGDSDEN